MGMVFPLRAVAIAAGVLTLLALYLFARERFGWPVALVSAAFLAVSPWHILYSRVGERAVLAPLGPFTAGDVLTYTVDAANRAQLFTLEDVPATGTLYAALEIYANGPMPETYPVVPSSFRFPNPPGCCVVIEPGLYIRQSALDGLPKQGDRAPWMLKQNYLTDIRTIRRDKIDDGVLSFS